MLTAIIITKNEAHNLAKCLESLQFCDQAVVVDTGSTDETTSIAKKYKAKVLSYVWNNNFSAARNWALEQVRSNWILFVDADERVSFELGNEITQAVATGDSVGFELRRVDHLWGQQLHYGDVKNTYLLRLGRRGAGTWKGRVHEGWELSGRVGRLKNPLLHFPHPHLADFLRKVNYYSSLKSQEFFKKGRQTNLLEIVFAAPWRFSVNYVFKFGWLDGVAGFVHAGVMAFYAFLVSAKLYLLSKGIGDED